uniref:MASE3 domain-containing protein n=1 Tax=Candidatus Electrothrix sp. TaxID=2170559 RepID=UPI0040579BE9
MKADTEKLRTHFSPACFVPFAVIVGLFLADEYSEILFHALAELFSIILISSIFLFTWNTRRFQKNHFFLFLGIAYLFIGSLDFVHILIYRDGEEILAGSTMNASLQLWVAARLMEGASLVLASFFFYNKANEYLVFLGYSLLVFVLLLTVFGQDFPVCYVTGEGVTSFKKACEYLACFFYFCSLYIIHKRQRDIDRNSLRFIQIAVILAAFSESISIIFAHQYNTPLDTTLGTLGKIFSLYCFFQAVFTESLLKPYNTLIDKIRAHEEHLEDKVRERTAALQQTTEQLEKEIADRIKAEKELIWELSVKNELAQVSDALISRSFSMQEIVGLVLDAGQRLTGCQQGFASTVDPVSGAVTAYPGKDSFILEGRKEQPVTLFSARQGDTYPGLWGQALNTQQGFYVDFISTDDQQSVLPFKLTPRKNALNVPVLLDKKVVGQIVLVDKQESFTRHDLAATERLAHLFALSVQRKEMEDALSKSEFECRSLFNDALDMIHIVDRQRKITSVNPVELNTLGYSREEIIGRPLVDIIHPTYKQGTTDVLEQMFQTKRCIKNYETALLGKNGQQVDIEVSAVPQLEQGRVVSIRAIMRNITERKKEEREREDLENQLRHSQKMEAIGTLAGGIAHDFNNILGPIFGYTEMALDVLPKDDLVRPWLKEVLSASHRARELVRQILTISRKADKEVQPLRVQLLIKEALKLLRFSIPSNIEIRQNLVPDCEAVLADPTRIHQVIMNLCTNAYHALRETGGVLEVSLKQVSLTQADIQKSMRLQPGEHLQLIVQDNGPGISAEILEKIFEPYFTTKAQGEGTGLGLAVVQSIILDLCGDIRVDSEPGKGTAFHVYLPVIQPGNGKVLPEDGEDLPRGTERILVVDDDLELVRMNQNRLERLGYQVAMYTESYEAFAAFQQEPDAFDLLVSDMTMPRMTGIDLTQKVLALCPDLPVIICTGFSELIDEEKAQKVGARALLMKPLTKKELACAVRQVLDQEGQKKE